MLFSLHSLAYLEFWTFDFCSPFLQYVWKADIVKLNTPPTQPFSITTDIRAHVDCEIQSDDAPNSHSNVDTIFELNFFLLFFLIRVDYLLEWLIFQSHWLQLLASSQYLADLCEIRIELDTSYDQKKEKRKNNVWSIICVFLSIRFGNREFHITDSIFMNKNVWFIHLNVYLTCEWNWWEKRNSGKTSNKQTWITLNQLSGKNKTHAGVKSYPTRSLCFILFIQITSYLLDFAYQNSSFYYQLSMFFLITVIFGGW